MLELPVVFESTASHALKLFFTPEFWQPFSELSVATICLALSGDGVKVCLL
jgi:hypothetical protein